MHDVLLTFLNGERSGVKELDVQLAGQSAHITGPGAPTLHRVLCDRPGGLEQQTFHLEYENTRLRECTATKGATPDTLALNFASHEPIDDY